MGTFGAALRNDYRMREMKADDLREALKAPQDADFIKPIIHEACLKYLEILDGNLVAVPKIANPYDVQIAAQQTGFIFTTREMTYCEVDGESLADFYQAMVSAAQKGGE